MEPGGSRPYSQKVSSNQNKIKKYKILWLMDPEVQCCIHKGFLVTPILSQINPIPRIDTHLFKIHYNIVLHLCLGRPKRLFPRSVSVNILKTLLPSSMYI